MCGGEGIVLLRGRWKSGSDVNVRVWQRKPRKRRINVEREKKKEALESFKSTIEIWKRRKGIKE